MRILVSNDDGIDAAGLIALRDAVADLGEVIVVAPELPQSASAHSITLREPLTVRQVTGADGAPLGASVNGRPADCIRLAVRRLLDEPPDLVLSGINEGANVGVNVFYSGTVAAAAEAAMSGIAAVAFSAFTGAGDVDYARAATLCRWVLDGLLDTGLTEGDLINVNLPTLGDAPVRGLRVVPQSTAGIEDLYLPHDDGNGGEAYRLSDEYSFIHEADTDVSAIHEGFVSVTPLHVDMTNRDRLIGLARRSWSEPPR